MENLYKDIKETIDKTYDIGELLVLIGILQTTLKIAEERANKLHWNS